MQSPLEYLQDPSDNDSESASLLCTPQIRRQTRLQTYYSVSSPASYSSGISDDCLDALSDLDIEIDRDRCDSSDIKSHSDTKLYCSPQLKAAIINKSLAITSPTMVLSTEATELNPQTRMMLSDKCCNCSLI